MLQNDFINKQNIKKFIWWLDIRPYFLFRFKKIFDHYNFQFQSKTMCEKSLKKCRNRYLWLKSVTICIEKWLKQLRLSWLSTDANGSPFMVKTKFSFISVYFRKTFEGNRERQPYWFQISSTLKNSSPKKIFLFCIIYYF